ncbi:right-handed parallel beta-helix repeat-containing protein [soil metagenome]
MRSMVAFVTGCLSIVVITAICAVAQTRPAPAALFFVSPTGRDTNSGRSADDAVATFEGARDAIRAAKKSGELREMPIVVRIGAGTYERLKPFVLHAADTGSSRSPITYCAAPGELVRVIGGPAIKNWMPVTDPAVLNRLDPVAREHILVADLKALGVHDVGLSVDGGTKIFFKQKQMMSARWPNSGSVKIVNVVGGKPIDIRGDKGDAVGKFTYDGDRPERWAGDRNAWLHGYWFWDWGDGRQKIANIDTQKKIITLAPPDHTYGYRKNQPYYAYNVLAELDSPGESYVDGESGKVYVWPPSDMAGEPPVVSVSRSMFELNQVSNITIEGLTMEECCGTAVVIKGGHDDRVLGCTVRNAGSWAVKVEGGERNGAMDCTIYDVGDGGVWLAGGDRKLLTSAGHYAINNHIHHYATWNNTYRPAVQLDGVGNIARNNLIHDAPHEAIAFDGNNHLIELNEIHDVVEKSNDAGAIYAGRDWTMRGTVIRYNYLHDIQGLDGRACVGVYLDDMWCGTTIYGNVFKKVRNATFIGGGRDNTIENNIFIDCEPAVHVDARGLNWAAEMGRDTLTARLTQVPYQNATWKSRYPQLPSILEKDPMSPLGNRVSHNICVGGKWLGLEDGLTDKTVKLENNVVDGPPSLVDAAKGDFQLRNHAPATAAGFKPIPLEQIGLRRDDHQLAPPIK